MAKVIIKKTYSQLKNTGNYENVKIETTLTKEMEGPTPKQIAEMSDKLIALAKKLTERDIEKYIKK